MNSFCVLLPELSAKVSDLLTSLVTRQDPNYFKCNCTILSFPRCFATRTLTAIPRMSLLNELGVRLGLAWLPELRRSLSGLIFNVSPPPPDRGRSFRVPAHLFLRPVVFERTGSDTKPRPETVEKASRRTPAKWKFNFSRKDGRIRL